MKKNIRFVTLFPDISNIHLVKDVGMIPYCMKKYYGFDSKIAIYKNENYPYFDDEVKKLDKVYLPLNSGKKHKKANCILYLLKNSRKIDVLHLYHPGTELSRILSTIYLFLNKRGLVYFHLDENGNDNISDFFAIHKNSIKSKLKLLLFKYITFNKNKRKRILFGIQNMHCLEQLKNQFPFENIEYIPDAYEDTSNTITNVKKENTVLFVGRVGNPQKRTDILLEGFKNAHPKIKDWNLKIIGPIEEDFKQYIEDFKKCNPDIMKNINFLGPIYDRKKLKNEYSKAKIFCLTSDYESFGLVLVEALANGCTLVSSDIITSKEILCGEKYGKMFKKGDAINLSETLVSVCNNDKLQKYVIKNSNNYIINNYSYKKSLSKLNDWIIKNKN